MAEEHKPYALPVVIRQDEEPDFQSDDPNASVWTVHFKTPSGNNSFIKIHSHNYNAENVARAVIAKSNTIEDVHRLKGAEAMMSYR